MKGFALIFGEGERTLSFNNKGVYPAIKKCILGVGINDAIRLQRSLLVYPGNRNGAVDAAITVAISKKKISRKKLG
jgi:hypothetical protein